MRQQEVVANPDLHPIYANVMQVSDESVCVEKKRHVSHTLKQVLTLASQPSQSGLSRALPVGACTEMQGRHTLLDRGSEPQTSWSCSSDHM